MESAHGYEGLHNRSMDQSKSKPQTTNPIKISPHFEDLDSSDTYISHIEELIKEKEAIQHARILNLLLEKVEPYNFTAAVFPELEKLEDELSELAPEDERFKDIKKQIGKCKLKKSNYLILSIRNILNLSERNKWGLCKNHDFIYIYNGSYWSNVDEKEFQKFLGEASERMGVNEFQAQLYTFRDELYKQFLSQAYLPSPPTDNNKVLVNLKNGTFEITHDDIKLRPFDRNDFITYQLPFEYDPAAEAPIFKNYLDRVLPDTERQNVLAEYMGYVFIRHGSNALKEEKALILYGSGANGKSVFFEIVYALLGAENVSSYALNSITNENGYSRAKLANKLVNYATELNADLKTAVFKQLVSGEPVEARLPYGEPFMLKHYAKLIFNCNELPRDVEHTNAYFRRFLIIPFDVTIPAEEQDKNLHTKIIENELAGVFNWVLDGLKRLLTQKKFSECNAAKNAVEQYRIESDSVQLFLTDNEYKPSVLGSISLKELHGKYIEFCKVGGYKACSNRTFAQRLRHAGYHVERKNTGFHVNAEITTPF